MSSTATNKSTKKRGILNRIRGFFRTKKTEKQITLLLAFLQPHFYEVHGFSL